MTLNVLYGASGREPLIAKVVREINPDVAVLTEARSTTPFDVVLDAVGPHRAWSGTLGDRERVVIVSRWPIVDSSAFGPPWSPSKWVHATVQPAAGSPFRVAGVSLFPHL